jgi:hypothetical protein
MCTCVASDMLPSGDARETTHPSAPSVRTTHAHPAASTVDTSLAIASSASLALSNSNDGLNGHGDMGDPFAHVRRIALASSRNSAAFGDAISTLDIGRAPPTASTILTAFSTDTGSYHIFTS